MGQKSFKIHMRWDADFFVTSHYVLIQQCMKQFDKMLNVKYVH